PLSPLPPGAGKKNDVYDNDEGPPVVISWRAWHEKTFATVPPVRWATEIDGLIERGMDQQVIVRVLDAKRGKAAHPLSAALSDLGAMYGAGVRTLDGLAEYRHRLAEEDDRRGGPGNPRGPKGTAGHTASPGAPPGRQQARRSGTPGSGAQGGRESYTGISE
ncbi:MAG: hypothetical protein Q8R28_16325, partial [Dehalococcoidia bacterium]|nr:hypothetical protein [Dehalococcoidia bacterium]